MLPRLLVATLVALALFPATAGAAARYFGFNDNATLTGHLGPARDARLLAATGANSVRITVDWSYVERARGKLDLSLYDPMYRAWLRRGIRPLLIVTGAPRWAWPPWVWCLKGRTCHYAPDRTRDADWARFVGAVAQRYPEAVAIEVWNEPNLPGFFAPAPDTGRYSELLRLAHGAVKREAPAMPVLGGSLAPVLSDAETPAGYGLRPFLRGIYDHGARGLMDGLSIHPYPTANDPARALTAIDAASEERDAHGDAVPLWLTEVGVSTVSAGEQRQADLLAALLPELAGLDGVEAVYVHTLIDPKRPQPSNPESGFGVLRGDGSRKPAYCAVAQAMGGTCRG